MFLVIKNQKKLFAKKLINVTILTKLIENLILKLTEEQLAILSCLS